MEMDGLRYFMRGSISRQNFLLAVLLAHMIPGKQGRT